MASSELTTIPGSLEHVRIQALPSSAFYIAEFITIDEERMLLEKIETAPKPRWKQLSKRRLQTWPSDLTNNTLLDSPLPKWLTEPVITRLLTLPITASKPDHIFSESPHGAPNHVLINEYLPGQGIMPHKDGGAYYPVVCTVSLGSPLCLDIYGTKDDGSREAEPKWKILQEPRSLLITTDQIYADFMHGIANVTDDVDLGSSTVANWDLLRTSSNIQNHRSERRTRLSLTYRDVLKVSKLGGTLGSMFGKR
ncbi:calpain [Mollisia scopiformis]|uniref:Calpain n=1 Tax=Mollisia scopiformis TaxID=149040 RepID=A0A194XMQ0_MOLSC|nr:calpain [Mollisia scopiformis]KUJ21052.1 calpain [Mollisia scopiformis]